MTVQDIIDKLDKLPNKQAELTFTSNVVNCDDATFDVPCTAEILGKDNLVALDKLVEVVLVRETPRSEADENNSISEILSNELGPITIAIDLSKGIYIDDEQGRTIREVEYNPGWTDGKAKEALVGEAVTKLLKML